MEYQIDPNISTNYPYKTLYAELDSNRKVIRLATSPIGLKYFRVGRVVERDGKKVFSSV